MIVGARLPNDAVYQALTNRSDALEDAGIASVNRIGDVLAPGAIIHAVYSGHRLGRELAAEEGAPIVRRDAPLRTLSDAEIAAISPMREH